MADQKPKPQRLRVRWHKRERDLLYSFDDFKSNGGLLCHYFQGIRWPQDKTLAEELTARGYDLTTLRFTISKFPSPTGEVSDARTTEPAPPPGIDIVSGTRILTR